MAYTSVNAVIVQNDADLTAAQAHGMATGMLCVNIQANSQYWLNELFQGTTPTDEEGSQLLIRLFEETRRLLLSDDFEFDLFLPDADNTPLTGQIIALREWCQGFLFGIGAAHVVANFSEEVREILRDIAEFTKLDTLSQSESDEEALMEITEYLRSAVLILRDELTGESGDNLH